MKANYAVAVRINGNLVVLSLHPTQETASNALASSRWSNAFVTTF